ncbi:hypothetical protein ACHAQA_006487 [Verticillium albo-atrum]
MAATMDVEALVAQMTENLAAIHTTIAGLSTKEHDARLDELEEKRDALLDALLSEYETELEELTAQRAKEEEEIAETRRREDEEREARRKQEDDELLAKKEAQDAERRDRLAQETGRVEEEADDDIDIIEAEVQKLLDEGQSKISELEEKRKEINRLIDERMSNPLPTFVPRKRARTRATDAPPADADADAATPADVAEAKKDAPVAEEAKPEEAKSEESKSTAPAALLAIEGVPNGDSAAGDDDASEKGASTADDTTTSKDEVSFHSPDPAGDDSGNDVKANENASAPASDGPGAERGGEEAGEPAARGVDVDVNEVTAQDDVPVAAEATKSSVDDDEPEETAELDGAEALAEVPANDKPAEREAPLEDSADDSANPTPNESSELDEKTDTHEDIKDQSIEGLSENSTHTPAATGEATEDDAEASDSQVPTEDLSAEGLGRDQAEEQSINQDAEDAPDSSDISGGVEEPQPRGVSPADDPVKKPVTDPLPTVEADVESTQGDVETDDQAESTLADDTPNHKSPDSKLVDEDALPAEVEAENLKDDVNASADVPEEDIEPTVDYYHTQSPEPESQDDGNAVSAKEIDDTDAAEDKTATPLEDVSEAESVKSADEEALTHEDLNTPVVAIDDERDTTDGKPEPSTPANVTEGPATAVDNPADDSVVVTQEETLSTGDPSVTVVVEEKEEAEETDNQSVADEALKSPATVIEEKDEMAEVVSSTDANTAEVKGNSDAIEEDDSVIKADKAIQPNSDFATSEADEVEEKNHQVSDKASILALDDETTQGEPIPVEATDGTKLSIEQNSPSSLKSPTQQDDARSVPDVPELAGLTEAPTQHIDSVESTVSDSELASTAKPAESVETQLAESEEPIRSDDTEVLVTELANDRSSSPVDLNKSLPSTGSISAEPSTENVGLESTNPATSAEVAALKVVTKPVELEGVAETASAATPNSPEGDEREETVQQSERTVERSDSAEPPEMTSSLVPTGSAKNSADRAVPTLDSVEATEPLTADVGSPKIDEFVKSTQSVNIADNHVEPEVIITSAASDVESARIDSPEPELASSSINERSVSGEPLSSSPDEESFLEIPEDTALDDAAGRRLDESLDTERVSSWLGEDDRQPPTPDNERTVRLDNELSQNQSSVAFEEPSSPLVDPDTPIPSIERDYDPSSDGDADDREADAKYELQRSYALPEETPEPIEATTRSPAPETATTPSVEPFIRDSEDYDSEAKAQELLAAVRPQDASVELISDDLSVPSSRDASSSQLGNPEVYSAREVSPAESFVDKSSIPDYYNTRSRSPSRFSEKPYLAGTEADRDELSAATKNDARPASPVAPEYIEDTAVKSFRDEVDEPQPQTTEKNNELTRASTEAGDLVTMPVETRDDAITQDASLAYDDWDAASDASVNGDSRFASTKTPWDAAHVEHESDNVVAAGLGLSDDEDEFHLESTTLRKEPVKHTYDLPSFSPVKKNYDLPSFSPTKQNHDFSSSNRAAEPALVDGYDSRESSEQPSVLDLYQTDEQDDGSAQEYAREDGFQRDWSSLRAATSFHSSSAAESRESLPGLSRAAFASTHIERSQPLPPWPENQAESANWQFPEEEESDKYQDFRANLPTTSDMNPANSTVLTNVRGQDTLLDEEAYSTDASDYDSEAEAEAEMVAMKRSVTSPTEQFDGFIREQTIRVVDEPDGAPKISEMTPRALQPTPLLLPRSETRDAEPSPLALRYSQSYSPTRGLAYGKHNPDRPRTPPTVKSPADPDFDPADFMPKDVTNVPWHARNDSAPISLRSQSTLDTAESSPVHSALHIDRHEPTIRDSWPQRPRIDSSLTDRGADEYDPFRTDSGVKFPRQTYVPPVQNLSPQRASVSSVAPGGNSVGSPGSLFHKMRSVFEKPGAAPPPHGGATESGSPIKSRPVSGVWHPVKTARPLSDLPDDNGITGYKRHIGLFNERPEDREENSALLRNTRSSYDGSGY